MQLRRVDGANIAVGFKARYPARCPAPPQVMVAVGKKVRALIEATFADWPGMLYIYEEFKEGE